jgi:hypothetical protein
VREERRGLVPRTPDALGEEDGDEYWAIWAQPGRSSRVILCNSLSWS